jgi:hypothetical protein
MKILASIFRELAGLFIDDGMLALAIGAVVVFAATAAALAPDSPVTAGMVLLVGCPAVLLGNVIRR